MLTIQLNALNALKIGRAYQKKWNEACSKSILKLQANIDTLKIIQLRFCSFLFAVCNVLHQIRRLKSENCRKHSGWKRIWSTNVNFMNEIFHIFHWYWPHFLASNRVQHDKWHHRRAAWFSNVKVIKFLNENHFTNDEQNAYMND